MIFIDFLAPPFLKVEKKNVKKEQYERKKKMKRYESKKNMIKIN